MLRSVDLDGLEKVYHYELNKAGSVQLRNVEDKGPEYVYNFTLSANNKVYTSNTYSIWDFASGLASVYKAGGIINGQDLLYGNNKTIERINAASDKFNSDLDNLLNSAYNFYAPKSPEGQAEAYLAASVGMTMELHSTVTPVNNSVSKPVISVNGGVTEAVESEVALPVTSPKYNPNKPALVNEPTQIPASQNGYAPNFENHPQLFPVSGTQRNIVKVKMTGSYVGDFAAANSEAGITGTKAPTGYTWHHLDDFNPSNGTATFQLIKTSTHRATIPHIGAVKQYEIHNNTTYRP